MPPPCSTRSWRAGRATRRPRSSSHCARRARPSPSWSGSRGRSRRLAASSRLSTWSTPPARGGGPSTFNISTAAAIVAARSPKHGNRSNTSRCGSADLLEALGVKIELEPGGGRPLHRGDRLRVHVRAPASRGDEARRPGAPRARRADDLQLPRPADQPGRARRQLLGVSDRLYQETIAEALLGLGCERALVVCADDGVDEITVSDRTRVVEVADGGTEEWFITPRTSGSPAPSCRRSRAGTRTRTPRRALGAGREPGPARDVVVLNAGAAILAAGGAHDLGAAASAPARRSTPAPPRACSSA